jgi:acyl transferase domain-containing protein
MKVIAHRSKLMSKMAGQGAVALLELDAEATEALIADYPGVEITVYSSPRQTVIAGPVDQVDAVIAAVPPRTASRGGSTWRSPRTPPDGSDPAGAAFGPGRSGARRPGHPFISTVTEDSSAPRLDADYWVANVRKPVQVQSGRGRRRGELRHVRRDQPAPAADL